MKWWQITFSHGGCIYKDDDDGTMIHISHFVTHVTFAFCKVFACVWPTIYLEAKVWHFVVKIWYKLKKKIAYIFSPFYCQFSTFFSHFSTFFVIFNLFVFFFFSKKFNFSQQLSKAWSTCRSTNFGDNFSVSVAKMQNWIAKIMGRVENMKRE